jgi:integrase
MRTKLTDATVRNAKAPKSGRLEMWDTLLLGFVFRITDKGARSWNVMYRSPTTRDGNGKPQLRRLKIGDVKIHDDGLGLTLAEARELAREELRKVAAGRDPADERQAHRDQPRPLPEIDTFGAVAEDWIAQIKKNSRASTHREYKRILDVDVIPRWRDRPVASITRRDVIKLLDEIADRGAEVQANKVFARLKTLFNWARKKDRLDASPVVGMEMPTKETTRDRALSDEEIIWFHRACDALGPKSPFGALFKLLLLTAQRLNEVATMEWSHLDLDKEKLWSIPRTVAKNDKAHEVQLSDAALELLRGLPRVKDRSLIFSTTGETAVSGFSRAKERLDKLMALERRRALGLPEKDDDYRTSLGLAKGKPLPLEIPGWTLHDLRRTATTGMAKLNIPPHVADKILNHTSGTISGVAAVYNRYQYSEERRAALQTWGRYVSHLVAPPADDKVADIAKARKSRARRSKGAAVLHA